ncbi:MAG: flippase-like domain-containing protein [Acidobacteria bacterium]|nr:flippase-like domain-containing protein [Acidobacteriota bacterium]
MIAQSKTRRWQVVASIALALVLFVYFLSRVSMADVLATVARVRVPWLLASVATALTSYVLRALRWGVILRPLGRPPVGDLLGCTAAGFATSAILPARAGEVIRPLLLSARTRLPAAGTMASILTERLADLAAILVIFGVAVPLARAELAASALTPLRDAAMLAAAGFVVAATAVLYALRKRDGAVGLLTRFLPERFKARGASFGHHVLDGLEAVRDPGSLVRLALWSFTTWGGSILQVLFLAKAFDVRLGLAGSAVFMVVSGLGLAVPTPAGVGGFHATIQFALTRLFGVDVATATAFALLHHAVCFVPITVLGLGYIASVGLTLGRVRTLQDEPPPGEGGS